MSPSNHEPKDKSITITNGTASERNCRLNTKRKDSVRWSGTDRAYEVWFADDQWAFKRDATRIEPGYHVIDVPHEKSTHKYSLDYELSTGQTKTHEYEIRLPGVASAGGGPNGPTIIGEG